MELEELNELLEELLDRLLELLDEELMMTRAAGAGVNAKSKKTTVVPVTSAYGSSTSTR